MYASFFGLKQDPFSIAPDPRYLFMSERHREALAHLLYGLDGGGGFVLLSGEIGTGKTTVCRCFLEQIPARCNVAYIFNPKLTAAELLQTVCDEFHLEVRPALGTAAPTAKDYIDALNAFLLRTHAAGQHNVLIIDEAQNLDADVLEQLRLLTNLETSERKLLQIVLIGQPELRRMLARPELEQLAQRVIARYHLDALSAAETAQYIRHRFAVAGGTAALPFDERAMQQIHRLARGVPRRINLLCDRALLGAYALGRATVNRAIVEKAAREVFDGEPGATPQAVRPRWLAAGVAGLVLLAAGAGWALRGEPPAGAATNAASSFPGSTGPAGSARAGAAARPDAATDTAGAGAPRPTANASAALPGTDLAALMAALPRQEGAAWRELGQAWHLPAADGEPCAAAAGLAPPVLCYRSGNATLAQVRQLDRPGLLTLFDERRRPAYALLTGLDERQAMLSANGTRYAVPLAALAQVWRGDYATFWRAPPGLTPRGAADAAAGPTADWLQSRLALLAPETSADAGQPLKARVAAFQMTQGLAADGRAGPVTLMQLNRATGVTEPRLQAAGPAKP